MKFKYIKYSTVLILSLFASVGCSSDDDNDDFDDDGIVTVDDGNDGVIIEEPEGPDFSGTYAQVDQMGRPAINTVFTSSESKDAFNVTIPSEQGAMFQSMFEANLEALSPAYTNPGDANALGFDAPDFTGLLATDVLTVSLDGTTTFFDGTNVLTGRALADDVVSTEFLLIFGGEDGTENPTLSDDFVDANDKEFLTSFPYLATPW